jgi:Flp pilus assembly protein TadD
MASSIPTAQRVRYASGYVELGMRREAAEELGAIAAGDRSRLDVMEAWIDLHFAAEDWGAAATAAHELAETFPDQPKGWISHAFAVRRLSGLPAAEAILLEAEKRIGETCALVHYNLACYRCVEGDLDGAWQRLSRALSMDPAWKEPALRDPDLKSLHARISGLR